MPLNLQSSMHGVHAPIHAPPGQHARCSSEPCASLLRRCLPWETGGTGETGGSDPGRQGGPWGQGGPGRQDRGDRALPDPLEQPPGPTTKHAPRLLLQTRVVAKGYASSSTKVMTSVLLNAHLPLFCSPTIRDPSLEILGNRESPRKCPRNLSAFSRLSLYR